MKRSDDQTVAYSLANNTCGAELKTISGATVIDWGTSGTAIPSGELPSGYASGTVGTVDILFTVSQSGHTASVYTVTATRTYLVPNE